MKTALIRALATVVPRAGGHDVPVPVLRYHSIDDTGSAISTAPAAFREHVRRLQAAGWIVTSLRGLMEGRAPRERAVVMTFDDGYANNHEVALAELTAAGFTATFFVVPGCVGGTPEWIDREVAGLLERGLEAIDADPSRFAGQARLRRDYARRFFPGLARLPEERALEEIQRLHRHRALPLMDWDQIRALHDAGMEVGSHTMSHVHLTEASPEETAEELEASRRTIGERLGDEPVSLCYPYGTFDGRVAEAAAAAGYRWACTCEKGYVTRARDAFRLPRVDVERAPVEHLDFLLEVRHRRLLDTAWRLQRSLHRRP